MPYSSGRTNTGVPKVLSTPERMPRDLASFAIAERSWNRQSWVTDRFGPDELGPIGDRRFDCGNLRHVHKRYFDALRSQILCSNR